MGVGGQRHAPAALFPVMSRYPLYGRLKKGDITLYFMQFYLLPVSSAVL